MSLQVTLGRGALIALGFGPSDIIHLFNLGKRLGNWLTTTDEDARFLQLLEADELDVLRRRGIVDLAAFKKTWNQSVTMLVNGRPNQVPRSDKAVAEALDNVTRFSVCMMAIVAVLDAFCQNSLVKQIVRQLLNDLFRTTSDQELTLSSEIDTRINAWRSAACVRGLHLKLRQIRIQLIHEGLVQEGFTPASDSPEIQMFLLWLLGGTSDEMTTASSDVTGMATCLSRTVFDILRVALPDHERLPAPCTLIYNNTATIRPSAASPNFAVENLQAKRPAKTAVPIDHPEEAISSFPINAEHGNRFRAAWVSGQHCGDLVEFRLRKSTHTDVQDGNDLSYDILDHGQSCGRVDDSIFALVHLQAFSVNQDICDALNNLLGNAHATQEDVRWLVKQYTDKPSWDYSIRVEHGLESLFVQDVRLQDEKQIYLFTATQAFFLGYYYSIVFRIVDTDKLLVRVVDGAFSYRSPALFKYMQGFVKGDMVPPSREAGLVARMSRQRLFEMLPCFLFSLQFKMDYTERDEWLIGFIGERALLASSIISPAVTPAGISRPVLIDTDVSSIPRHQSGAVISGRSEFLSWSFKDSLSAPLSRALDCGPPEDFTMHIEADWDANSNDTVICVRYKGRRIGSYHPLIADKLFLMAYVDPVISPRPGYLDQVTTCNISHILENKINYHATAPVLVQAKGRPCMRYAMVALTGNTSCRVASNCVQTAAEQLPARPIYGGVGLMVIGSET